MREKMIWQGGKGRDAGKIYEITEASPFASFKWGMRAAHALSNVIPSEYMRSMDGVSLWLQNAGLSEVISAKPDELAPLLDELMACVRFKNSLDAASSFAIIPEDDRGYIEEPGTLLELYSEVLRLHTNFYGGGQL